MRFEDLQKGVRCKLQVVAEQSKGNYFTVVTDDAEVFKLPKIKFQKDSQIIPEWIDVYVKNLAGGYPQLAQDISQIVPKFYSEGNEYEFIIKGRRPGDKVIYDVEDDNGLFFQLPNPPASLQKGRRVKCRVSKIRGVYVQLQYTGQLTRHMRLTFRSPEEWTSLVKTDINPGLIRYFMRRNPDFAEVEKSYMAGEADWVISAISMFWQNVTKYLVQTRLDEGHRMRSLLIRFIDLCAGICLLIVEGSDYLKDLSAEQRSEVQERLSGYIETFHQISHAAGLIERGEEEAFIDNILNNLKQAGYLYHPAKQFRIMMTILRLRPELISDNKTTGQTSRITELFEALHSWPMANWREEPFRSALVDQLEIFISENSDLADSLSIGATGADNRQLNRVIRAIAIQSLLAKPTDRVNMTLNKARLYRFLSYFHSDDIDPLLYKAVGAILGNEYTSDFYWTDTERIQLLQEKASFYSDNENNLRTQSKVFASGQMRIELSPRQLIVRKTFVDEDSSVLPNDTIRWLSPKIYLPHSVKTPAASRKNDLKAYRTMWAEIENEIFGEKEAAATKTEIRKKLPEDGEEVEIVIDDLFVDYKNNVLKFHCQISDDYLKGSGWINAVPEDFLPWLDINDFPDKYDGDLDIFRAPDGAPLKFPARVMNLGPASGDNIRFTMKRQIEDYITELPTIGEVSHAVVRNIYISNDPRYYNHYLCLSDRGYTVKVRIEGDGPRLERGTHVNVRYLELERKHNSSQPRFMVGEIVEVTGAPSNYGKKVPLKNLLQGLGHPDEKFSDDTENLEVVEAQDVLSREEILQIIMMLQRRAYAEKEYIQAFNYLSLAALLCRAIEDNELRNEVRLHQELLSLLQYFARNKKVDFEELEKHKDEVKGHTMIEKLYNKLEIVSSIGRPEMNSRLWEISAGDDDAEKRLASLVLSHNLLPADGFESGKKEVMAQISSILNVNATEAQIKYYGEEGQSVEFKSSLIFTNKEKDHMQPRPEAQTHEILEIITGFLNSRGGYLYIGVNDLGYEAGLEGDLSYRRWKGKKASLDGMILDLERAIHDNLPENAWNSIHISPDPESVKGVIVVEIDAVRKPVALDGVYWVRNSSSTRPRLGSDLDSFLEHRQENYDKWLYKRHQEMAMHVEAPEAKSARQTPDGKNSRKKTEAAPLGMEFNSLEALASLRQSSSQEQPAAHKAATGRHRQNVLHDYEPGFVHPSYYLHFNTDRTLYSTTEDEYKEFDEDKLCVLAVKDYERQSWLVASFADGSVARTEIAELEEGGKVPARFTHESRLIFVDIADLKDFLVTYLRQPSGLYFVRVDRVADLTQSHSLKSPGKKLYDGDYEIVRQEIVSEEMVKTFYDKPFEISARQAGFTLKPKPGMTGQETVEADINRVYPG